MGKSTISMVMFHSFLYVYQRVSMEKIHERCHLNTFPATWMVRNWRFNLGKARE
jgi:hypothetical protein